jgi:tRNA (guanosine-2'-O-)-methyltransferase
MTINEEINERIYAKLFDAITENKQEMFERIAPERTRHITVALENIYQTHNASAVVRTCDCLGVQDLHVIEQRNEYVVQRDIALGAGRWVDIHNHSNKSTATQDCLLTLKQKGYRIIATTPHGNSKSIFDIDISEPMAFVFGTERKGISQEALDLADEAVFIPMFGFTESFNVSVSVAMTLNTIRQRLNESKIDWRLSKSEQTALKIEWCKRILNGGDYMYERFLEECLKK